MSRLLFFLVFLAVSQSAVAMDGDRALTEFLHTGWSVADGAPSGVHGFAQTTDGYLWLASTSGLFRFDGVRFARYEPTHGGSLQFRNISALLATPDGGLWIGRAGSAIFVKNGEAITYRLSDGLTATVFRFVLDREGTVWAATSRGLQRFQRSRWETVAQEWNFSAESATDLFLDSRGNLWVTAPGALFCLSPNTRAFQMRKMTGPWLIREGPDRTLWLSEHGIGVRAVNGPLAQLLDRSKPTLALPGGPHDVLVDRGGNIWFTDIGIARLGNLDQLGGVKIDSRGDRIERFTQKDGLTADTVVASLEDREGNIWVATTAGLDRFRRRNVMPGPFPLTRESLALATDQQGTVLVASSQSVMQLRDGNVSVRATINMPVGYQFARASIRCVYRDAEGALWLGGHGVLTRVIGSVAENIDLPSEVPVDDQWDVQAVTRDQVGDLWVSIQQHGVFRRQNGVWQQFRRQQLVADDRAPVTLWTDTGGRVWFGYNGSRIVALDGQNTKTYTSDGLDIGTVTHIGGHDDRMWVVGQTGFALFDGNRFLTIAGEADADFRGISGIVKTPNGDFWIKQATGLAHIPAVEIANRMRNRQHPLRYELFDFRDGVPGSPSPNEPLPSAVLAGDGRIWMSGSNGPHWVDPARIYRNPLPPPVTVEAIYVDGKRLEPSAIPRLPVLPSNVRIEYSALSLSITERVRFRYRLDGVDGDWQDAGTRRAAYYTKLPPGEFHFRVIASNNDGVWNESGAVVSLVVPPAFFQTTWFLGLCVTSACGLLWAAYSVHLRRLSTQMHSRLEERVAERTRIARELHDTMLQSFQGLMLRLQVIEDILPEGKARQQLEQALERADQAIAEGRSAVYDLRRSAASANDLAEAVRALGEELATEDSAAFRLVVEGTTRDLNPLVREEVYAITREAIRNAFRHARAHHVETDIAYGERVFRVRIRDDGAGIPPEKLAHGPSGHYGLQGIRERASQIAGTLDIRARPGAGTEIDLTVAGDIAYASPAGRSVLRWFAKKAGEE